MSYFEMTLFSNNRAFRDAFFHASDAFVLLEITWISSPGPLTDECHRMLERAENRVGSGRVGSGLGKRAPCWKLALYSVKVLRRLSLLLPPLLEIRRAVTTTSSGTEILNLTENITAVHSIREIRGVLFKRKSQTGTLIRLLLVALEPNCDL